MLEDRRLGREQFLLGERGEGGQLWLMAHSPWTRRGRGLKGPALCHVPAGAQYPAVILAFSGFAGDFKVL